MTQKKKTVLTSKTTKPKKKQPLTVEVVLQQRQEELELINKKLAQSQVELEAAYRQYADLYDFAPVGYFTLTRNGAIHQVNLAGADLLGVNHDEVTRLRLAAFVSTESRSAFNIFFEKLLSGEGKQACELVLEKKGTGLIWVCLEATCFEGGDVCRAMLTDITERKQMEQTLQESENRFRMLLQDVSTIAVQGYAIDGTTQYWNSASEQLYGYSSQEALGRSLLDLIIPPEMRSDVWHAIQQMGETGEPIPAAELSLMRKDGSRVQVYSSHTIVSVPGRTPELFCLDVDLTERRRMANLLQARVRISEFAESHTFDELLQKTLDEAEALTGSQIGFAHFIEADQKTLLLQMWSTNTLDNMCAAEGKGRHYSVNEAGVWADCVATRVPLVHNDYANLLARKGLPQGHAPVLRELVVPVLRNDLIVMIMGVGNKSTDYDDNDIETLSQLANLAWDIVQRRQAEELLKESEWRTRIVSELTTDYIFVVDVDPSGSLKFRWASDNMFRLTGRTVEDAATVDVWKTIIHPDDNVRFFEFVNQILSTAEAGDLECRSFYKHGGERWIHIFARPQAGEENRVKVIIGAIQDITERKQAQEALKKSEAHYHDLVETSQDLIWQCDSEGRYTYLNPAWEQVFGYKTKEMLGKKFADFQTLQMAARDQKEFSRLMRGNSIKGFETCHIGRLGNEIHLVFNAKPISDENGKVIGTHGTAYDITERKKAEQALQESESLHRNMNENSPLGMHFYKLNNNDQLIFVGANPAADKLMGVDNSQFTGKTIEEAFPPLIQTEVPTRYRDAAAKGIPWSTEQITYEDRQVVGAFHVRAFQTTPGNMVAIFSDITVRKRAEEALRESKELFSLFMLHSPIYAFIKDVTPTESRVLQASDNYLQMIGISGRDMVGKTMEELFPAEAAAKFTADDWSVVSSGEVLKLDEDLNGRHYTSIKFPIVQGDKTLLAGYTIDITERVRAQEALKQSEAQYRLLIENQIDLVVKVDNTGNFLYVSPSYCKVFGKAETELLGKSFIPLVHPDDVETTQHEMEKLYQFPYSCQLEQRAMTKDGWRWFSWSDTAELNNKSEVVSIIGVGRDITERKQVEVELQYMKEGLEAANRELQTALALQQQLAHTDALTGINNRRHLYELADHEFEIAARYKHSLSAIMFDIDHFKEVNDTFGHAIGDQILQRVTQVACAKLRSADVIGRYGGEEFVIILPMTNAKQAYPLAERIRAGVVAIRVPTEKGDATVTLSIGIVELIHGAQNGSAESLIRRADEAMYAAKQAGRNRTEIGES